MYWTIFQKGNIPFSLYNISSNAKIFAWNLVDKNRLQLFLWRCYLTCEQKTTNTRANFNLLLFLLKMLTILSFSFVGSYYSLVCQEILHRKICLQIRLLFPLYSPHCATNPCFSWSHLYQVSLWALKMFLNVTSNQWKLYNNIMVFNNHI